LKRVNVVEKKRGGGRWAVGGGEERSLKKYTKAVGGSEEKRGAG
jgi:hypothetical protein